MARLLKLGVIAIVLGCSATVSASGRGHEPVTLHHWGVFWTFRDVLDDFENLHNGSGGSPAIRVVAAQSAEVDMSGDSQRLLCSIAGGAPPDVVVFARHAVGELAQRGAFECLQPLIERDLRERPDDPFTVRQEDYWPPCWNEASHEGRLYALPTDTDNRALYYNVDLLEKHGEALVAAGCVDPGDPSKPGPPRTWKQLRAAAEIMTQYDAEGRLVRVGFIPNYGNSWLYLYGWLNGGRFLSADGRTCTMDSPEIVDALAYMTEMYEAMGGAQAVYAFQSSMREGDLDPFLAGKVAMKIDGNWFLPHIANNRRDMRFGVTLAPAPEGRERFGWCGGWSYAIPKGCKHPNEAWELMKYLVSPRASGIKLTANQQMAQAGGQVFIPSINARRDIALTEMNVCVFDNPGLEPKFKDAVHVFLDSLPESKFRPATPVGQLLWNEHVRAMEAGIYMSYDREDIPRNAQLALSHSTAIVQRELDRIYGPPKGRVIRWGPIVAGYAVLLAVAFGFMVVYFGRKMRAGGYFRREFYAGYAFAAPWFLGFVLFGGGPILFSLVISLCQYDVLTPPRFVGTANYVTMLTKDPLFYKSMGNTCFMALGLPLGMAVGLGIAMLLSYEIRGMAVYRTFFYLPAIMPAVAASILWIWVFNPEQGILNALLAKVGIDGPPWLQSHVWSKPALILMGLWGAGGSMIIWLAGLKAIPAQLYEAAELDGAGAVRRFWHVTLPMLTPYIFFNLIMGLIGTFQIFTQAYIMTQGGPVDSTLFYAYALFNNAFRYLKMGYASAMAWVLFAIVLALTALQLRLARLWVHYEHER